MVKSQRNETTQTRLNRGQMKLGTIAKFSRALNMFTTLGSGCTCTLLLSFQTFSKKLQIFRKLFLNISVAKFPK